MLDRRVRREVPVNATMADVLRGDARWCVVEGDSGVVVPTLPAASINALVTDPPSAIAFMGARWDGDKGGRAQWVAWLAGILAASRAAMTDGSRAFVWSLPRTSHWTGCAVEDAGFAIETTVQHLFATGWPKGASQLKPAAETWWLARTGRSEALNIDACRVGTSSTQRKNRAPMGYGGNEPSPDGYVTGSTEGRYPPNVVLSHTSGCVMHGATQVRTGDKPREWTAGRAGNANAYGTATVRPARTHTEEGGVETVDDWRCVEGCAVAELAAQSGERASGAMRAGTPRRNLQRYSGGFSPSHATESDIEASSGTAARFYPQFPADDPAAPYNAPLFRYEAKPSRAEKSAGVHLDARPADAYAAHRGRRMEGHPMRHDGEPATSAPNDHPTVKPVALMRWLIRLVTKPGDVVLDPFGGSGTTGVAALLEGRRVILVEESARSAAIARARCEHALPDVAAPVRVPAARLSVDGPLFAARGAR